MAFDAGRLAAGPVAAVRRGRAGRRRRGRARLPQAPARPPRPARRRAAPAGRRRPRHRRGSATRRHPTARRTRVDRRTSSTPTTRCTRRWCSAPATTSRRTASPTWSSGCRAASTRRSSRCSPSTRSAPTGCTASSMPSRLLVGPLRERRREAGRRTSASTTARSPIEPAHAGRARHAGAVVRGPGARPHRGEPAVPHPRPDADGPVEQVRLARAHRPATRARWRSATPPSTATPSAATPCIKDVLKTRVFTLCRRRNERAGRELIPEAVSPSRRRPSCAPTSATTRASRPTRCSTRSCAQYVEQDRTAAEIIAAGPRPRRRRAGSPGSSTWPSTSAARPRRAPASPPRRSARTAASPSPTATAASDAT